MCTNQSIEKEVPAGQHDKQKLLFSGTYNVTNYKRDI